MKWRSFVMENGPYLSWAIAVVATLGSLFFSEVMEFEPCKLCWYQRILMYPLVIILGIAAVKKDRNISVYVLPLTILGAAVSTYHYLLEKTDWIPSTSFSCGIVPCDVDYINWLGFITIPFLALIAFVLITLIQLLMRFYSRT
jgi:disulfide bond formation protein DsbB